MRQQVSSNVVAWLIALVALSIGIDMIYATTLPGGLNVSVQTIVAAAMALYAIYGLLTAENARINVSLLYLLLLLITYFVFSIMRSEQMVRSLTYFILLLMSFITFIFLSTRLNDKTLQKSNRLIYLAGVVIAAALFTRYVYVVAFKFASVLSSRELWDIGSNDVYEVEYGRYIAFQGFSGDPNLVGSATAIILFCGLAVRFRRYNMVRHLLNIFLVLVIFSSFSRGAISALAATFIITAYVTGNRQYRYYLAIIGAIFIAGLVWMVAGEFPSINPLDKFNQDFSRRIADWSTLINSVKANPILGCGLRCDEIMLGKYAENSYIAILVNIGLVGAALYYGIVLFVYCRFISNIREIIRQHENVLPWFSYTTYLILVMWFVSMDVKIHFWTALAVLAAFSIYSQRPRIRKLASETG